MNKYIKSLVNIASNIDSIIDESGSIDFLYSKDYANINELVERETPEKPNYKGKFPQCGHKGCIKLLHNIMQSRCDSCGGIIDWRV